MIYVTVGTLFLDFPRLVRKMDEIAEATQERVIIQTGLGTTLPAHCEHFDFKPHEEVKALQREARVVVCHGGIGSVLDALEARKPLLVVPRRKAFREHLTDHQVDLAKAVERRGWGRAIFDIDDLTAACAEPPAPFEGYRSGRHRLLAAIRDNVERVAARKSFLKGTPA